MWKFYPNNMIIKEYYEDIVLLGVFVIEGSTDHTSVNVNGG